MPRAYYRPFTAYEEALGFHAVRRNAYVLCVLYFGGIVFKIMLCSRYSSTTPNSGALPAEASSYHHDAGASVAAEQIGGGDHNYANAINDVAREQRYRGGNHSNLPPIA